VRILYSEAVTGASATNFANYTVTNSAGQIQPITNATLVNGTNVTLGLGSLSGTGLRLVVNGVRDISAAANAISNVVVILGVTEQAVGREDAWKYLLINTNEIVQTNYYKLGFDDSAWAGPSPSVLHVEDGGLAGGWNKGTQVSPTMFEPVTSNYYNTVYFRKTVPSSSLSGTVTLRITVLYDDGVVLYLNGVELNRFNMPAGTIRAATQASAGHENTDSVPTFDVVVTNWLSGNNVFAAEIHQNGAASSDLVFGLDVSVIVPSQVVTPPVPVQIVSHPQSRSVGTNANVAFSITSIGDPTITFQWRKNGTAIPLANSATLVLNGVRGSDAGNYSVRIANSFSSATSQVAVLTVTNAGSSCTTTTPPPTVLAYTDSGANIVLSWTNPSTNTCNEKAVYALQQTLVLSNLTGTTPWTTVTLTSPFSTPKTNTTRFFRLRLQ
jgi:hypothetical protein